MNKAKKIIISLIIAMLALLGLYTTSNAYYVGQKNIKISLNKYNSNPNIYCLEHHDSLSNYKVMKYTVVRKVVLKGKDAEDDKGRKVTHINNARLAYIVNASEEGYGKGSRKNAVWNFMGTWMNNVGKKFGIKYLHNYVKGSKTSLDKKAAEYEKRFKDSNGELKAIEDKTDKNNIKGKIDGDTNNMIIGPFKWSFDGEVQDIIVKDKNGNKLENVKFGNYVSSNGKKTFKIIDVKKVKSNKNCYLYIPFNTDVDKIKITVRAKVEVKAATLWFLKAKAASFQNMMIAEPKTGYEEVITDFEYSPKIFGDLDLIKVNKDNESFKLPNVSFYVRTISGKYVKATQDGSKYITEAYVDKNQATVFKTDEKGEILIKKLIIGKYQLLEIDNPNYGYDPAVISEENPIATVTISANSDTTKKILGNKQIYVKLSGYVWEDIVSGVKGEQKQTYKDSIYSSENDTLLKGITVRLMDRTTGQAEKTATTDSKGAYLFMDVSTDKLVKGDYYIEFEYDGITYTNVTPLVDGNKTAQNTSKAAEDTNVRKEFNNGFATVEGRESKQPNKGYTRDTAGNEKHQLTYTIKTDNKTEDGSNYTTATLDHNQNSEQYKITSTTDVPKYYLKDVFTYGMEEIKNNNLGLWRREQPNIQIMKDLENVRVTINGYENTYQYASRYRNIGQEAEDGFNVGVKFGKKYGSKAYTRAIYKADYEYKNDANKSKELKVYATYRIVMKNSSNNATGDDSLTARVNSIADYFDKGYTFVNTGRNLDQKGNIVENVEHSEVDTTSYANYNKVIINTNAGIKAGETASVFVQLQLTPEKVARIMDNPNAEAVEREFVNIAELNSYSVLQHNEPYAGIDKYSNPGNVEPGNKTTYENDTDSAPALRLEVANARKLTGTVFEDNTGSLSIKTGEVRQGDGKYGSGDVGIAGVVVTLTENSGSGKTYTATTGENGNFEIEGFIPGDYTITYTWGDQKYTVQNYKSTIYSQETQERKNNVANWDKYTDWYRKEIDTRFSDAKDNYTTREKIDKETETISQNTNPTINKMDATAPGIAVGVELFDTTAINGDLHNQIYTDSDGHRFETTVKNIDFGIARRPMQQLKITKRVSKVKATLANGQVIADFTIDENGKIIGQHNHVTYMKPTADGINKGFVKLELDNELIQGCRLEVEYEIKATNMSELDYKSQEFYYYGTQTGELAALTPNKIIDYLDEEWAFEEDGAWQIKQANDRIFTALVTEEVLNNISDKKILYTEALKNKQLRPIPGNTKGGESATINLKTSKVLSTTDEIALNNDAELVEIGKTWGATPNQKPGDYIPGETSTLAQLATLEYKVDSGMAEEVIVTPSTGENRSYIMPIAIGTIALIILGAGVVVIKKKTLTNK